MLRITVVDSHNSFLSCPTNQNVIYLIKGSVPPCHRIFPRGGVVEHHHQSTKQFRSTDSLKLLKEHCGNPYKFANLPWNRLVPKVNSFITWVSSAAFFRVIDADESCALLPKCLQTCTNLNTRDVTKPLSQLCTTLTTYSENCFGSHWLKLTISTESPLRLRY